jgi:hypothetical protein
MSAKPGFFDNLLAGVFGDTKRPDAQRPDLAAPTRKRGYSITAPRAAS